MKNPLDFLPKLDGFSPMPIGIMIPFMKAQTDYMMFTGGVMWQYGKRKIDAMSNETFNALDEEKLQSMAHEHFNNVMRNMQIEIKQIDGIQKDLIDKMVDLEREKIRVMPELIAQIPAGFLEGLGDLAGVKADPEQAPGGSAHPKGKRGLPKTPPPTIPVDTQGNQTLEEEFVPTDQGQVDFLEEQLSKAIKNRDGLKEQSRITAQAIGRERNANKRKEYATALSSYQMRITNLDKTIANLRTMLAKY